MELYLKYALLGLAIALPVGAITVEMTKQGLKNGFMHGWAIGLGAMTIDLLLVLSMYAGVASILSLPYVQLPLWLIGAGFLAYLGYDSIRHADHDITPPDEKAQKSLARTYRNGLLVAVSPGSLIFWVSVFGTVLSNSYQDSNPLAFAIAAAGVLSGILLHDLGLLSIVALGRRLLRRAAIRWISVAAGFILIGFAAFFVYEFVADLMDYIHA